MLPDKRIGGCGGARTFAPRVAGWWLEAQAARQAGQMARARRFLRWVLIASPRDEEAWLQLTGLVDRPDEQLIYLRQASHFLPGSACIQDAMRRAWAQHLELSSGPLAAGRRVARCLPCRMSTGFGHSNDRRFVDPARRTSRKGVPSRFPALQSQSSNIRPASRLLVAGRRRRPGIWCAGPDAAGRLAFFFVLLVYLMILSQGL